MTSYTMSCIITDQVPSRWNAFLEQMHLNSVNDCILFYESEVNLLLRKHNYGI